MNQKIGRLTARKMFGKGTTIINGSNEKKRQKKLNKTAKVYPVPVRTGPNKGTHELPR